MILHSLQYACRNKSISVVRMLVDANAYTDARNNSTGCVPLHEAALHGNLEVVKFLLDLGVPHLPRCTYGQIPAQLARDAGHNATAEYLGMCNCALQFHIYNFVVTVW